MLVQGCSSSQLRGASGVARVEIRDDRPWDHCPALGFKEPKNGVTSFFLHFFSPLHCHLNWVGTIPFEWGLNPWEWIAVHLCPGFGGSPATNPPKTSSIRERIIFCF